MQKTLLQHRIGAETSMTTATAMTAMTAAVSRIDAVTVGLEEEPAQLDNRYGEGIADVKKTKNFSSVDVKMLYGADLPV